MYCPRCNQQQLSDRVRFCSRCGLNLSAVAELLSGDKALTTPEADAGATTSQRRKGVRVGAKLVFFSVALLPLTLALGMLMHTPGPLLISLALFFLGLTQMIYVRLFGENLLPEIRRPQPAALDNPERGFPLLSSRGAPVPAPDSSRMSTGEMLRPPSVTENTTSLLEKK